MSHENSAGVSLQRAPVGSMGESDFAVEKPDGRSLRQVARVAMVTAHVGRMDP